MNGYLRTLVFFLSPFLFVSGTAMAGDVREDFESGKPKIKYKTNKEGQKHGSYIEYYDTGKIKIKTTYKSGALNGKYRANFPTGKMQIKTVYKNGKRHGEYREKNAAGDTIVDVIYLSGEIAYPKSQKKITKTLAEIYRGKKDKKKKKKSKRRKKKSKGDGKAGGDDPLADAKNIQAVKRLNAYRYIVGVSWDVTLNKEYCDYAKAGAGICDKIGKLDHTPKDPGMPEAEYKKAYHGTSHSNLSMGGGTPPSVDRYMDDSDKTNIDRVGHRRWCINPTMAQTGFGEAGRFSAMYSLDKKRVDAPDYDYVAYPTNGFMPVQYFGGNYAWSISLNPKKYQKPTKGGVKVKVYLLKKSKKRKLPNTDKREKTLEINYFNIENSGFGIPNCIIFRPTGVMVRPGVRYWVEISGLKTSAGEATTLRYIVEFF